MNKRILTVFLATIMVTGCLAGCGQSDDVQNNNEKTSSVTENKTESKAEAEEQSSVESEGLTHPLTTEPITFTMFVNRNNATIEAKDTYFIQYLEYWMEEQGYDITFEIQEATDEGQQIQLMLGTDTVPDIVWGPKLGNGAIMTYGVEQGIVLDWTPYINETYMPYFSALMEANPSMANGITAPDGGIYALPQYTDRTWLDGVGHRSGGLYYSKATMDAVGVKVPTTLDEFYDVLLAIKDYYAENNIEGAPLMDASAFVETYIWQCLGYYGSTGYNLRYGDDFRIKNDELVFPAYTEDYRTFLEIMNKLYMEGILDQDYLTMDSATINAHIAENTCAMFGHWSLTPATDWENWYCLPPIQIGETEQIAITVSDVYDSGRIWVSANTKHPEVLAYMLDYVYSPEAGMLQGYGPMEGQDPLGLYEGFYYDEETDTIASRDFDKKTFEGAPAVGDLWQNYMRIVNQCNMKNGQENYARELLGAPLLDPIVIKDSITGEDIVCVYKNYTGVSKHWREGCYNEWGKYSTKIAIPGVFLTADEQTRATELFTVISDFITSESAKFITGLRPIDEVDDYFEELKGLGIEDYIAIYENAYADFMTKTFK